MSENLFTPKMSRVAAEETGSISLPKDDGLGNLLHRIAQYVAVILLGVTALFFTPGTWATLGFDKVILVLTGGAVVVMLMSLLSLRRAKVSTILPLTLGLFWMVVFAALASGVLSGDIKDTLRGNVIETQTVSFFALLALTMSIPLVLQNSKEMTIKALTFFGITSTLLMIYVTLRLILGADFLPLGSFAAVTTTPVGTFNDLAIFAGLVIVTSLVTLVQLPLRSAVQYVVSALVMLSLFVLMVVNFFNIWIVVGFFALLILLYLLSRDVLFRSTEKTAVVNSRTLIIITSLVCVISVIFIVAGEYAGKKMSDLTSVDYVEVRPSIDATLGVAQAVYSTNAFFGIGANRFADAWRLHKDPSINETIFWDTDFAAGSGYVPTVFVNLGLLGGILLIAFHLGLLYIGYRMLLKPTERDPYWYYFGVVSFAAACFLWGMSYVYVPGAAVLLLTAFFTGMVFVSAAALTPQSVRVIPLMVNRQRGFFLMGMIILVVVVSVSTLFTVGKQYLAEAHFNEARMTATSPDVFEQAAIDAYGLYPNERFKSAQAQIHLATVTSLLGIQEPSQEQQETFVRSAELALVLAEEVMKSDISDPDNHAVLAAVYSNLALAGIEGAQKRAATELAEAQRLDPRNPSYHLIGAQIAARIGDVETARTEVSQALEIKRNYTEAMYLSAQLDISEGKTESAIATTRSIITLEPRNPTRYFQLGVLLAATDQIPEAVAAYRAAIVLDPQYANARYLLALAYLNSNETNEALTQLNEVLKTNQDNQQLQELIRQVQSGEYQVPPVQGFETLVSEQVGGEANDGTLNTSDVDSGLVTPVNTISETEEGASASAGIVLPSQETENSTVVPEGTEAAPVE